MIVVVGLPAYVQSTAGEGSAGGPAVAIAAAAVAAGRFVELVGKVGDDGAGDAVVLGLGRMGIGHAALLRDPSRSTPVLSSIAATVGAVGAAAPDAVSTADAEADVVADDEPRNEVEILPADPAARPGLEAGDISLGLRYLAETKVVVVAEPISDAAIAAAVEGASFAGARLVVVVAAGATSAHLPPEATVLEAPADDDGSFGRVVGVFAAGLDGGAEPGKAFSDAVKSAGWEPVEG
jgi:hypothetical protein